MSYLWPFITAVIGGIGIIVGNVLSAKSNDKNLKSQLTSQRELLRQEHEFQRSEKEKERKEKIYLDGLIQLNRLSLKYIDLKFCRDEPEFIAASEKVYQHVSSKDASIVIEELILHAPEIVHIKYIETNSIWGGYFEALKKHPNPTLKTGGAIIDTLLEEFQDARKELVEEMKKDLNIDES